jgi:hypothetical protein
MFNEIEKCFFNRNKEEEEEEGEDLDGDNYDE